MLLACYVSSPSRKGFTLLELLATVAVIGILAALLVPAVGKVRESAHRAACVGNMRQIGAALIAFGNENDGWGPETFGHRGLGGLSSGSRYRTFGQLLPYLGYADVPPAAENKTTPKVLFCPGTSAWNRKVLDDYPGYETTYWLGLEATRDQPESKRLINIPSNRVVITDYGRWWDPRPVQDNHRAAGINVFRMNGSITWLPAKQTEGLPEFDWTALDTLQ